MFDQVGKRAAFGPTPRSDVPHQFAIAWIVHAPTLYEAACELAVKVGIELMD